MHDNGNYENKINPFAAGIMGMIVGAALGVSAANILSDKNARKMLKDKFEEIKDKARDKFELMKGELEDKEEELEEEPDDEKKKN